MAVSIPRPGRRRGLRRTAIAMAFAAVLNAGPAWAERPLWELGAGATALSWPAYPGSAERTFFALPFPYVVYRGAFLRAEGQQVRGLFFDTDRLELDVSGSGSPSVDSDDVPVREGMPDLDLSFELGPSLKAYLYRGRRDTLTAALNLRALMSLDFPDMSYQGLLLNPALQWERNWLPTLATGAVLNLRFADSGYHDYFYAVAPEFATASRPEYAARAGYNGTSFALFGELRLRRDWRLRLVADVRSLHGAAFRDSPLVERRHGFSVHLMVSRIFLRSARSASVVDAREGRPVTDGQPH